MTIRGAKILKASLCRSKNRAALERFLPEQEREFLSSLPEYQNPELDQPVEIHWSWFLPVLKKYSSVEQRLFLHCFNSHDAKRLEESLGIEPSETPLSKTACHFLKKELNLEGSFPPAYLPPSPLNRILVLPKKKLLWLINSLSLYDLAYEFRQILDTKNLKRLYSFLSEEQRELLGKITVPTDLKPLPRLGLDLWQGSLEELKSLLHRRGLARLGVALSGSDQDLISMLCHKLDTGRGNSLMKLYEKGPLPETESIQKQIEELIRYL